MLNHISSMKKVHLYCITAPSRSLIQVPSTLLVGGIWMVVQCPRGRVVLCGGIQCRITRFQMGDRSGVRCQMGMAHQYQCRRDPLNRFHWGRGMVLCRFERCMGLDQGWLSRLGREHRLGLSLVDLGYRSGLSYRL